MRRRRLLSAAGAGLSLLGGCLSPGSRTAPSSDPSGGRAESAPSITDSRGPARGESTATVETESVETDEDVTYIESENAVRYVAGWRRENFTQTGGEDPSEREPIYETKPFDEWAQRQCLKAAGRAAADHVNSELDTDSVSSRLQNGVEGSDVAAVVTVETILDRMGSP